MLQVLRAWLLVALLLGAGAAEALTLASRERSFSAGLTISVVGFEPPPILPVSERIEARGDVAVVNGLGDRAIEVLAPAFPSPTLERGRAAARSGLMRAVFAPGGQQRAALRAARSPRPLVEPALDLCRFRFGEAGACSGSFALPPARRMLRSATVEAIDAFEAIAASTISPARGVSLELRSVARPALDRPPTGGEIRLLSPERTHFISASSFSVSFAGSAEVNLIPEPGTAALLAAGLAVLAARRRRR